MAGLAAVGLAVLVTRLVGFFELGRRVVVLGACVVRRVAAGFRVVLVAAVFLLGALVDTRVTGFLVVAFGLAVVAMRTGFFVVFRLPPAPAPPAAPPATGPAA